MTDFSPGERAEADQQIERGIDLALEAAATYDDRDSLDAVKAFATDMLAAGPDREALACMAAGLAVRLRRSGVQW